MNPLANGFKFHKNPSHANYFEYALQLNGQYGLASLKFKGGGEKLVTFDIIFK